MLMLTEYRSTETYGARGSTGGTRDTSRAVTRQPVDDSGASKSGSTTPSSTYAGGLVQVTIGAKQAEYYVNLTDVSFLSQIGTGAGLGGSIGSILPGVGSAVGTVIGSVGAGITRLFGVGTGDRKSVRHTVRSFIEDAIAASSPQLIQSPYRETKDYGDCAVLAGEYSLADIKKMIDSIFKQVLSQLKPGSDEFNDINNAYKSVRYTTARHSDVCILKFSQKVIPDDRISKGGTDGSTVGGGSGSVDGSSAGNTKIVNGEAVSGIPPLAIAAGIAGIIILVGSR